MFELIASGFHTAFNLPTIILLIVGVAGGILIGSLPGLTATMGVAILLPFTFNMNANEGLTLLVAIYIGAIYGGSISAILLKTPGTPAAAATVLDGHELALQGKACKALNLSVIASFIGGIISVIVLMTLSPILAKFALRFSAPEYFALAIFGLTIIASISGKSIIKGLISGFFGLIIATVGMDPVSSSPRFTLGSFWLLEGFSVVPVLIGLFAISEMLTQVELIGKEAIIKKFKIDRSYLTWKEIISMLPTMIKSGFLGTFIGSIPGAGGDIAAFVSYNEAVRASKNDPEFGHGCLKGVAAPEAGNNGVTGGALIPLLTLGVPGDAVAAILLGALTIQGLAPGPLLFQQQSDVVYGLFASMFMANFVMLILGLLLIPVFSRVIEIPKNIILPIIFMLSVIGSYAINNNVFDIIVMLLCGVIGFFLTKAKIPLSPIVLAIILGPMAETNLRKAVIMYEGSFSFLYSRPITVFFLAMALFSIFTAYKRSKKESV